MSRKVIVLTFLSMDGVMQAPGGPEEDASGGFKHGGWTVPFFDEALGNEMGRQMSEPFDLLLGRKTYDIFAAYWPHQDEPGLNNATKFVASRSSAPLPWGPSALLEGDAAEAVKRLKQDDGADLQVHGSADFIQTLLKHELVDEFWLKFIPVVLGDGKRLFGKGTMPASFRLKETKATPSGVIIASYERAGEVQTGSVGP